jgi:hypothetical protein
MPQGGEAAGLVPEDLGEPDAAGVYTHSTATGTLYFRLAQPHPFATPHWEWSTDRAFWIPTSCVSVHWRWGLWQLQSLRCYHCCVRSIVCLQYPL